MTVTFQVGDREFGHSGNLDVDFWVWSSLFAVLNDSQERKEKERNTPRLTRT